MQFLDSSSLICLLITYPYGRQVIITVILVVVVAVSVVLVVHIVVVVVGKQIAYKLHSLTARNLHENILGRYYINFIFAILQPPPPSLPSLYPGRHIKYQVAAHMPLPPPSPHCGALK